MKTYIACNSSSFAAKVRAALLQVGIQCSPAHVLSMESIVGALATRPDDAPTLVFVASVQFSSDELSSLRQLSGSGQRGLAIVAIGSAFSPATILQVIRSGAVDCLDINNEFERELRGLLDRINSVPHDSANMGRLFTVIAPVGGSGASLLACNLAALLAQRQSTCALLDLHVRGGDLATLLKCAPPHTLLSLADKQEQLDRAMFEQSLYKHESGVHLLASPGPLGDYRAIRPELIQRTVQLARNCFETVIVDLEDCEHPGQVETLATSDRIIVVVRPDIVSLFQTKKCLEFLARAHVSRDHIHLVANRTGQPKEFDVTQAEGMLGMRFTHRLPDDSATVNASVNLGEPLVLMSPHTAISKSISQLMDSLVGAVPTTPAPTWATRQLCRLKSLASIAGLISA